MNNMNGLYGYYIMVIDTSRICFNPSKIIIHDSCILCVLCMHILACTYMHSCMQTPVHAENLNGMNAYIQCMHARPVCMHTNSKYYTCTIQHYTCITQYYACMNQLLCMHNSSAYIQHPNTCMQIPGAINFI